MKRVNRVIYLYSAMVLWVGPLGAAQWEVQESFSYYVPQSSLWDQGLGGEAKLIYWRTDSLGLALTGGLSQWEIDRQYQNVVNLPGTMIKDQAWDGDVQYIPMGLSAMVRVQRPIYYENSYQLTFEAGVRYMHTESDVELVEVGQVWNPGSPQAFRNTFDAHVEYGLVGRVAGQAAFDFGPQSTLFLGGGYQFNLKTGDVTVDALGISKELNLAAFFFEIGLAFMW